jgi:hypothetical protein
MSSKQNKMEMTAATARSPKTDNITKPYEARLKGLFSDRGGTVSPTCIADSAMEKYANKAASHLKFCDRNDL